MERSLERFEYVPRAEKTVRITLAPSEAPGEPIHGELFSNFLENLGASFHGGVLSQLLANPTMAEHNLPQDQRDLLNAYGRTMEQIHKLNDEERSELVNWRPRKLSTGFGSFIFDDEADDLVPLPWRIRPRGRGRGGEPGRVGPAVFLECDGDKVVLSQGIVPPIHREERYQGYVWLRAIGEGKIKVEFRKRDAVGEDDLGSPLAECQLQWPSAQWTKQKFSLAIPASSLKPFEPIDFCVTITGTGKVWIDRVILEPEDSIDGFDPDVIGLLRKLAPPILRWPGGNFASGYHFWHGIGDLDLRQTVPNPAWGGIDTNFLGTDEFIKLCRLIGSKPLICVNQGNGTAHEAAAWVEYCNGSPDTYWGRKRAENGHPEPYGVEYWEVGNEIYGPWQVGHCGAEENARRYKEWSAEMRRVDPSIKLIATGSFSDFLDREHSWNGDLRWNESLLRHGGPNLECISLHALPENHRGFPAGHTNRDIFKDLLAHVWRWERHDLPELFLQAEELRPGEDIGLAIDEWGILGAAHLPEVGNAAGAIYGALLLNMVIRLKERVRMASPNGLFHAGCLRKFGPVLYWDPQVEVLHRYSRFAGGKLWRVRCEAPSYDAPRNFTAQAVSGVPIVDAIAVQQPNGDLEIVLVNKDPEEPQSVVIESPTFGGSLQVVSAEVLSGDETLMNTPLAPNRVKFEPLKEAVQISGPSLQLEIEPSSVTCLVLRGV
ncbi:alpha-L-arabinofuranosidase C-terminal domain-containing protein [Candidatus Darwinibacter acetoxidans]